MFDLNTIFTHFSRQDIEEFYQLYQLWSLRKKREEIVVQMYELQQRIAENEARLKAVSPSTIALATLTQFRALGVDNLDLLEHMLERGDEWLDHTLQLFELCERLDILQENATQWCIHALEGAYKWIESMGDISEQGDSNSSTMLSIPVIPTEQPLSEVQPPSKTTEAEFLKKLMNEDEESSDAACPSPDGENEEIEYAIPNAPPEIQEESKPTTQDLPPIEQDSRDETTEHPLEPDSKYQDTEYVIPNVPPEIQKEDESTTQDQTQDLPPIEQESRDETTEHPLEPDSKYQDYEDTEYAISNAPPEVQEESKPTIQDLPPTEPNSRDNDLIQLEDSAPASKASEITEIPYSGKKTRDNNNEGEVRKSSESTRKPTKLYSTKQKEKHKKQKLHQNKRTQKKPYNQVIQENEAPNPAEYKNT